MPGTENMTLGWVYLRFMEWDPLKVIKMSVFDGYDTAITSADLRSFVWTS